MNDISLAEVDVQALLPQQPPFVMIDRLTHSGPGFTTTQLTVRRDNLFMEANDVLNPCALVENIAQTCAARLGYINQRKGQVQQGVIGAINNLVVVRAARLGETLTTTVEVTHELMQLMQVHATVMVGSEVIAHGEMKMALIGGKG